MKHRQINRDDPNERAAALQLLKSIGDPKLTLDDIMAHGLIVDDGATLRVSVAGIYHTAYIRHEGTA